MRAIEVRDERPTWDVTAPEGHAANVVQVSEVSSEEAVLTPSSNSSAGHEEDPVPTSPSPPVPREGPDEQADHARWEAFVTTRRWTFAKTYVDKYPHEWTHAKPNTDAEFMWAVDYLNRHGKVERFWGWERPYFYFTGPHGTHRYWTMGAPAHETEIINRCFPDATDYWPRLTPEQATERRREVWQALERLAAVLPNKRRKGVEAACIAYLYGEIDVLPAFAPGS